MKSLKYILEGILGSIETDLDKNFPDEIVEMISVWQKVRWRKTGNFFQAYPDDIALGALYKSFNLLEDCECERVPRLNMQAHRRNHDDVVIIKAGSRSAVGIFICYAKTGDCLRIYEDSIVDDRNGGYGINPTVLVQPVHSIHMLNTFTKGSEQYIILPGACWEPLKKVLMP